MSGIFAMWRRDGSEPIAATLASAAAGLSLSAAERSALHSDRSAGVAVSAAFPSQQIYQSPRHLVACDANLLNEEECRSCCGEGGPVPRDAPTAALLSALYDRFGSAFVEKLRGNFSFILWDRRERRLLAAVDGFGVNRLVYFEDRNVLLVGSRIDALLRSGSIRREINPRAIANVLNYSANLGPQTIFSKVHRLLPGTILLAAGKSTSISTYWDMRYGPDVRSDEDRLAQELESVVEKSVSAHMKSSSPAARGAFLSGGTDSSTVVGMMARAGGSPVRAFSIGFQEQPFNELEYAALAAGKFQADHHTFLVGPEDCLQALPGMVRSFDEPFGNSSAIPTYFCARMAAQHGVTKLLAGDGGDELFAGNEWYLTDRIFEAYQAVPSFLRKGLVEPVLAGLPVQDGLIGKARSYVRRSNMPRFERGMSYHFLCAHRPEDILSGDLQRELETYSILEIPQRYYRDAPAQTHLDRLLYVDVKIILGDSDLPKVTSMCELAGVQASFPFLDRSVAEFSGRIPARLKIKGSQKRYLFKRAFRNLLPPEIIAKKKHGFGIPVSTWLKSDKNMRELGRDVLSSARSHQRGYFRPGFVDDLFRKHEEDETSYYGDTLWTFLVLELWHRQFVDQPLSVAV